MAITHSGTIITFSGVTTGNDIRSYITANPTLGTVVGRTANMNASIRPLDATSEFIDNNCTWVFNGTYHWDFTLTCERFEITDGVIVYTQNQKSHSTQPRANIIKLENVQYRIEVGSGRSDFFSNGDSGFEFSNVQFLSYGSGNFLHLPTKGGLLENVSVIVGSGSLTFQPDCNSGQELIMRNWTLDGVSSIIGNGGQDLTAVTRLENLNWNRDEWAIGNSNRGQYYKVINPIKPSTWTSYRGSSNLSTTRTDEFHTHNMKVVDENNTPLEAAKVQLRRQDGTLVYGLLTDANGDILEQEVMTYEQTGTGTDFTQYSDFLLGSISYNNAIVSGTRELQNGRIDEVLTAVTDISITETNKATVDAYTTQETPSKAYDHLKAILVDNYAGQSVTYVQTDLGKTVIDAGVFDVEIDGTGSGAPTIVGNKITLNAPFTGDIITTGNVTTINGGLVRGNITDATLDSSFEFVSISNWEIYPTVADRTAKTNLIASGTGSEFYHFAKGDNLDYYMAVTTATGTENNLTILAADTVVGKNEVSLDNTALILSLIQGQEDMPKNIHEYDYTNNPTPADSFKEKQEKVQQLTKLIPATV